MRIRASFGRYDIGGEPGDDERIKHMENLFAKTPIQVEAFRELIDRDMKRQNRKEEEKAQ